MPSTFMCVLGVELRSSCLQVLYWLIVLYVCMRTYALVYSNIHLYTYMCRAKITSRHHSSDVHLAFCQDSHLRVSVAMLKDCDQKHPGKEGVNFSSQPSGHTPSGQKVKHALEELLLTGMLLVAFSWPAQTAFLQLRTISQEWPRPHSVGPPSLKHQSAVMKPPDALTYRPVLGRHLLN